MKYENKKSILKNKNGITLLETVLYVAILIIALPALLMFTLQLQQEQGLIAARSRMEQTEALVGSQMTYELTQSDAIDITGSTLGVDSSVFVFQDDIGTVITIDRTTDNITFGETLQAVNRLRYKKGAEPAIWISDPDLDVTQWNVQAVRDSSSNLTGIRIQYQIEMLNPGGSPFRNVSVSSDSTIVLQPHSIEL